MNVKFKETLLIKKPKKHCKYCRTTENLTYDHKTALVKGGKDELHNIQVLCRWCNSVKSDRSHGELMHLARWAWVVNMARAKLGKRPLGLKKKDYETLQAQQER